MSKKRENLEVIVGFIDEVNDKAEKAAAFALGFLDTLSVEAEKRLEEAIATEAGDTAREQKIESVINNVTKNLGNLFSKPSSGFSEATDKVSEPVTKEEKIAFVRKFYKDKHNIDVWPSSNDVAEAIVDQVYSVIKTP